MDAFKKKIKLACQSELDPLSLEPMPGLEKKIKVELGSGREPDVDTELAQNDGGEYTVKTNPANTAPADDVTFVSCWIKPEEVVVSGMELDSQSDSGDSNAAQEQVPAAPNTHRDDDSRQRERKSAEFATEKNFPYDAFPERFRRPTEVGQHASAAHEGSEDAESPKSSAFACETYFPCDFCRKTFATKRGRDRHASLHDVDKKHKCRICGQGFIWASKVREHVKAVHLGIKDFECTACDKRFVTASQLQRHRVVHTGEKRFACEICGVTFTQKAARDGHMPSHDAAMRHECAECGKRFPSTEKFLRHVRIHAEAKCRTGEKNFACDICGKRFALKGNRNQHLLTVHK